MTIVDEGDGIYHMGDISLHVLPHGVQFHVDRYADFTWKDLEELTHFLLELLLSKKRL